MITLPIVPWLVITVSALVLAVCAGFIGGAIMRTGKRGDEDIKNAPAECRTCVYDGAIAKGMIDPHCFRCVADGKLTEYKRRKK